MLLSFVFNKISRTIKTPFDSLYEIVRDYVFADM